MKSSKFLPFTQFVVTVLLLLIVVSSYSPPSLATARDVQNKDQFTINYDVSLFPRTATINTIRVTLTLSNLMGETPPSAKWYDPDGNSISSGGSLVREYIRSYGSLIETRDYFYISNRASSLKPGTYRVVVSGYADETFFLKDPKKYTYLPLVLTPLQPPEDFSKLYPEDGKEDTPINYFLEWQASAGTETYEYCYDTSDDNSCANWESAGSETMVSLTELAPLTTYYWQIRATNIKGTVYANGSEESFWSFTTNDGQVDQVMILVEAGNFMMGCDPDHNDGYDCPSDEIPLHEVYLDSYYLDKYEVTNEQYLVCVSTGACAEPQDLSSDTHTDYFNNPRYYDYPVINVTWQDAANYCEWLSKRLPTEAEWEKAARGETPQAYPWGDDPATCDLANYGTNYRPEESCVGDTTPVGSYPDGVSPYGIFDMAGNVDEWVNDWYDFEYYHDRPDPDINPTGPTSGDKRTIRGGAWYGVDSSYIRTGERWGITPDFYYPALGFRCASDAP